MKRLALGVSVALALLLSACSSRPTTAINGQLSANTRTTSAEPQAQPVTEVAAAKKGPGRTTTSRPPHTTRTSRPTETTVPTPTVPSTPPLPSASGVAGAVLFQTDCSADRPCSLKPGAADLKLLDAKGNVVASGASNKNGAFIIQAPPGTYTLVAKPPSKKQACDPVSVTVSDGQYTTTSIQCGAK